MRFALMTSEPVAMGTSCEPFQYAVTPHARYAGGLRSLSC